MDQMQQSSEGFPTFRSMRLEDIHRICEIEKLSFPTPWSEAAFKNELMDNHFAQYLVMVWGGEVVGYGGMWKVMDEAHITNIAIHPDFRGRKWGELLLTEMQHLAIGSGMVRMTLEVRVSNDIAQKLYVKMGFRPVGIRKGYYTDNNEDAMIMWAELPKLRKRSKHEHD